MSYTLENKSNNIVGPNREYIMVDGKPVTGKYTSDGAVIEGSNGEKYPVGLPKVPKSIGNQGKSGYDDDPHAKMQEALGTKSQSKIPLSFFDNKPYTSGGATFVFNAIKHGVLNDFESFMIELAERHGISVQNTELMSGLLRGMVADLYANGASDKRDMTGVIKVDNNVVYERIWFKEVANKYVGSNIRRIARAAAPIIVRLLQVDREVFHDLVSARAKEFSVSIEDAVYLFDGADMLPTAPSHLKRLNLESRMIRLSRADLSSNTNTELVEMKYGESYEDSVKRAETKEMSRG